jgi:hypothetical protein
MSKNRTSRRPEAWRAVVLRDEANSLLAAILTLSDMPEASPAETEAAA